jgi:hypothetical protein
VPAPGHPGLCPADDHDLDHDDNHHHDPTVLVILPSGVVLDGSLLLRPSVPVLCLGREMLSARVSSLVSRR